MSEPTIVNSKTYHNQMARSDLQQLLESDAAVFPCSLTLRTLQSWYDKNATLFLTYYKGYESTSNDRPDEAIGWLVAFPMKANAWEQFINGHLEEHNITDDMILEQNSSSWTSEDLEKGYGIHIWHIEKSSSWNHVCSKPFKDVCYDDLQNSVVQLNSHNTHCKGFSALCATTEGTRAFIKLQFELIGEFDFVVENEHGGRKILHSLERPNENNWKIVFPCGMHVKRIELQHPQAII